MQIELKRIQREVGITFVYVTHDQSEALTMSDRLAVMQDGRIEQLGSPSEIYEQPATRFVAGFIGTSNIVRGTIDSVNAEGAVVRTGADESVVVPLRAPRAPERRSPRRSAREDADDARPPRRRLCAARPDRRGRLPRHLDQLQRSTALGELVVYQLNAGEDLIAPSEATRSGSDGCRCTDTSCWMPTNPRSPPMTDSPLTSLRLGRRDLLRYAGVGAGFAAGRLRGERPGKKQATGSTLEAETKAFWAGKPRPARSTGPTGRSTSMSARTRATTRRSTSSPRRPASR